MLVDWASSEQFNGPIRPFMNGIVGTVSLYQFQLAVLVVCTLSGSKVLANLTPMQTRAELLRATW